MMAIRIGRITPALVHRCPDGPSDHAAFCSAFIDGHPISDVLLVSRRTAATSESGSNSVSL